MSIRDATAADLPAMEAAKRRAGLEAWPHILPRPVLERLGMPERWRAAVESPAPRTRSLVAEVDGAVVGFAIVRPSEDADAGDLTGELDGFYTDPAVWGVGAGRRLLAAATAALRDLGFGVATLWTAAENHRPRRIYERAGWRTDGTERHRSFEGVDLVEVRYRIGLREGRR